MTAALISLISTGCLVCAGFGMGILCERWTQYRRKIDKQPETN